jgi:glutathione S-transferase
MLTLYDYLPSQNGWKVRQLLQLLDRPYRTVPVSIFEGEGQTPAYLRINPTGTVPAIALEDGRVLAESNAILAYLAEGTPYLPANAFGRAKVWQWLCFEQERVESVIGSLRFWTLTGQLPRRPPALVELKRQQALRALNMLDTELATRPFLAGEHFTIADIAVFAYAGRAEEADCPLAPHPHLRAWIERIETRPGFLATMYPYSVDPHAPRP